MRPSASPARSSWRAAAWRARSPRSVWSSALDCSASASSACSRAWRSRRSASTRCCSARWVWVSAASALSWARAALCSSCWRWPSASVARRSRSRSFSTLRRCAARAAKTAMATTTSTMMMISRTFMTGPVPARERAEPVGNVLQVPPVNDLPLIASGKVREMYDLGDRILMVASDRISTYDVVHPTPIPDKGKVLTGLSAFWFQRTGHIVRNHFISATEGVPDDVRGRAMAVRKLEMLPVECIVRGYITGSGWKDYQSSGTVSGLELPPGLRESERLPTPLFTPSTKADEGHDEAIDFERAAELVGDRELMTRVRDVSISLYVFAAEHARARGVILADTKFEFGLDADGELVVGDEVLTPDSSRYWPADGYEAGHGQPSFDKQYVRDWASSSGWDKSPPAPPIPDDIVTGTRARYIEAYERITGEPFDDWQARTAP